MRPFTAGGATVARDPQDAVDGTDAVITVLFDGDAVLDVMAGVDLPAGCVWVQSSTVGLDATQRVADLAGDRGWAVLDAPVLGTAGPAADESLVVLVSGDPRAAAAAAPVIDAVGRT